LLTVTFASIGRCCAAERDAALAANTEPRRATMREDLIPRM
jgi:hypothetical protein